MNYKKKIYKKKRKNELKVFIEKKWEQNKKKGRIIKETKEEDLKKELNMKKKKELIKKKEILER